MTQPEKRTEEASELAMKCGVSRKLNDPYHGSVELAMEQATFEFDVTPDEWIEQA